MRYKISKINNIILIPSPDLEYVSIYFKGDVFIIKILLLDDFLNPL